MKQFIFGIGFIWNASIRHDENVGEEFRFISSENAITSVLLDDCYRAYRYSHSNPAPLVSISLSDIRDGMKRPFSSNVEEPSPQRTENINIRITTLTLLDSICGTMKEMTATKNAATIVNEETIAFDPERTMKLAGVDFDVDGDPRDLS